MINLLEPVRAAQETPSVVIGPDLRCASPNAAWRRLNLPGGNSRERVDKLFPASDVAGHVLDVLASGVPSENVAVRIGEDGAERFLCASFHPYPSAAKPRKVLMRAWEMNAQLLLDGDTGEVLAANDAGKTVFSGTPRSPESPCFAGPFAGPFAEPLRSPEARTAALTEAARNGSHYLGKFKHRRPDGSEVELESLLVLVEDRRPLGRQDTWSLTK